MRLVRTATNPAGKAIIVEDRQVDGRFFESHWPATGHGGRWLVVEFVPGQSTGWHAVHCDVYVYIAEGQLEFALDGGETTTVVAGDLVIEGDNTLHSWTNTGATLARVSAVEIDLP